MLSAMAKIKAVADKAGVGVPHLAIAWTLAKPQVISMIPGGSSTSQLAANMAARARLAPALKAQLDNATDELMGAALDIYQPDAGQRVELNRAFFFHGSLRKIEQCTSTANLGLGWGVHAAVFCSHAASDVGTVLGISLIPYTVSPHFTKWLGVGGR